MEELFVYHCTLSSITTFDYRRGVHFGGRISALQAAFRKLPPNEYAFFHLYSCKLESDKFYDSEDVGCKEEWDKVIVKAKKEGYKVIRYRNKYEPDSYPSYLVFAEGVIKHSNRHSIHSSNVEDEINTIFANF